jgi:hypothetical protein
MKPPGRKTIPRPPLKVKPYVDRTVNAHHATPTARPNRNYIDTDLTLPRQAQRIVGGSEADVGA